MHFASIHPPTLILRNPNWWREESRCSTKGNVCWEQWPDLPRPTSTPGAQILDTFAGAPPGLPESLEEPSPEKPQPAAPQALPAPRHNPPAGRSASSGRPEPRPPGPQGGAREAAAGLRLPLPARAAAPAAGSRPAAAALCAPRPDGSRASPGYGHFHFPQLYRRESESENR